MNNELTSQFERVEEFFNDFTVEYKTCLELGLITGRLKVITQDIITKLRTVLDQAMWHFFEKYVKPTISSEQASKARIYFPIAKDSHSLKSILGNGCMSDLDHQFPSLYRFIESVQPYKNDANKWLALLCKYSNERHTRLSPQKQIEERVVTIKDDKTGSTVVVGNFADFTGTIFGATVDVNRHEINSTPGVSSRKETFKDIVFEDSGVSVLRFCTQAYENTKKLVEHFSQFV